MNARSISFPLRSALLGLCGVMSIALAAAAWEEPQASPLFAASMQDAYARMGANDLAQVQHLRDRPFRRAPGALSFPGFVPAAMVIEVEGALWRPLDASGRATNSSQTIWRGNPGGATRLGPRPFDITMINTCDQGPTCGGVTCGVTCGPPMPTLCMATCMGGATCKPTATCYATTCTGDWGTPTCASPTCSGSEPTCAGTCRPSECPVALYSVQVPRSGEFQVSFTASAQLQYGLQCCTNLTSVGWVDVASSAGVNGNVTLTHTNNAPHAYYRLSIRTP